MMTIDCVICLCAFKLNQFFYIFYIFTFFILLFKKKYKMKA
jgi:hypothetical protein